MSNEISCYAIFFAEKIFFVVAKKVWYKICLGTCLGTA